MQLRSLVLRKDTTFSENCMVPRIEPCGIPPNTDNDEELHVAMELTQHDM